MAGSVAYGITDAHGTERLVRALYVVDTCGHKSRIYRAVGGSRKYSDYFQNIALFGYFRNAQRLPEPNSGNIFCAAFDNGWFWYIPLSATMTSVGAVVSRELAAEIQGDPEKMLHKMIGQCPLIADYLAGCRANHRRRVRADPGSQGLFISSLAILATWFFPRRRRGLFRRSCIFVRCTSRDTRRTPRRTL